MANKTRGEYDVELGGKTRTLRLRTLQTQEIDQKVGGIIPAIKEQRLLPLAMATVEVGIRHDVKRITPEKVADWLDELDGDSYWERIGEIVKSLTSALRMDEDSEDEEAEASKPAKKAAKE